jgi:uncharacterized RDD family membrane protein YckC
MRWTDEVRIETPEQIDVDLELAGLGSRFVAQFIDWLLEFLIILVFAIAVGLIEAAVQWAAPLRRRPELMWALAAIAAFFICFLYNTVFEVARNGQTPGKKYCGIRVIREGGAALDFGAGCVRNLLAVADLLPLFYFLGAALILLSGRRQRLGDLAAGTIVVRERSVGAPHEASAAVKRFARTEIGFSAAQLANCARNDRQVLRAFLQRLPDLPDANRAQLARKLTEQLVRKTGHVNPAPLHDSEQALAFLASLYRDLEEHGRRGY